MARAVARAKASAEERREQVLAAGVAEFAEHGYHAARTAAIAELAGISQPYVYALFPDKKALFLACQERIRTEIRAVFRAAAAQQPALVPAKAGLAGGAEGNGSPEAAAEAALARLAAGWRALLPDRDLMRCQLQGFAAAADPEIRAAVRAGVMDSIDLVVALTGASRARVAVFVARGVLLSIGATLDLPADYLPVSPA